MNEVEAVSIGQVASATGLAVATIRAWERRYGRPVPLRLPSGHRRYAVADIPWLRRVAEAVARGHRPSEVVPLDDGALEELLAEAAEAPAVDLEVFLERIRHYDAEGLRRALEKAALPLSARAMVQGCVAPLVETIGRLWADGRLHVRHEHFAREVIEDFLRKLHAAMPAGAGARRIVLATLPGEAHGLGLQMAAVYAATAGWHPLILGTEMPLDEIERAVGETSASALGISVSLCSGGPNVDRTLREVKAALPDDVALLIGGQGARGARRGVRGAHYLEDLDALGAWFDER